MIQEEWKVGSSVRMLNLKQETADPAVGALTLNEARTRLREGLGKLPELAKNLEAPPEIRAVSIEPRWFLLLEHEEPEGTALRPHLPFQGIETGRVAVRALAAPLSEVLTPFDFDPLTVADDKTFLDRLSGQLNLPDYVRNDLPDMY